MHYRTGQFDGYVCPGDTVTLESGMFEIRATIYADEDSTPDDAECYSEDHIAAWKRNEWFYCGISLSLWLGGVCVEKYAASLWGIECNLPGTDNEHLNESARELLPEAKQEAANKRDYFLRLLNAA